jgi:hypothetical protein
MIESQNVKVQTILTGTVSTGAVTNSDPVDTRGYGYAVFCISVAKSTDGTATSGITSIVLLEGTAATGGTTEVAAFKGFASTTSFTAGAGFLLGSSANSSIPYEFVWNVDLSKRQPYLRVAVQGLSATYSAVSAKCILMSPEFSPAVSSDVGNANWVVG